METKTIEMTPEELIQFEQYKRAKELKQKREENRESYKKLIEETVNSVFPNLEAISKNLIEEKELVYKAFRDAILLKAEMYDIKSNQRSHTFSNAAGTHRITLGQYEIDEYDDTVNEGEAKVKEYLGSLARDDDSKMLVAGITSLLSKNKQGQFKASRVMQLRKTAEESGSDLFMDGVRIIEEAHKPTVSKFYIKAEKKSEKGAWTSIPLGMTEA